MTQSNDLPSRMNRAEDNIIDLRLAVSALLQATEKNSDDIAQLIEVSRQTLEMSRHNLEINGRNSDAIAVLQSSQLQTNEAIQGIRAAVERLDRLADYLIRRDDRQTE
ncbi:MAG: hypothetical protein VKL39_12435 [Leptolyngbyaceae bacterium]|nr:hypothetical protein [Leptolyngbyaceae bacterium]